MTDVRALVQDLLAEAHRAPADIAQLMRRAAVELNERERFVTVRGEPMRFADFDPTPAPIMPPAGDRESYEQGAEGLS